jgi:hypothetical protein
MPADVAVDAHGIGLAVWSRVTSTNQQILESREFRLP